MMSYVVVIGNPELQIGGGILPEAEEKEKELGYIQHQ